MLIRFPTGARVWLAAGITDMRRGFDGLASLIQGTLLEDPFSGRFVWPEASSGIVHLTQAQLSMLLEGIDWRGPVRTQKPIQV